ncbi:unnamed protein product [Schistosoma mattheei]|uniref:Uncharacterized protein n=1 Tax=Schistosoma mattheei TaxID=31246 RepID=A0A183NTV6_9TREM|nr:unnamed protein product [Schistosoma mattheei]
MPIPSIHVNSIEDNGNNDRRKNKPSIPILQVVGDNMDGRENDVNSNDDDDDVMTAEEEAAIARRFLSGNDQTEQRRMSSLDMYLSQPEVKQEPMIINRHISLKEEEKGFEAEQMRLRQKEREEMEKHQEQLRLEREEVKKARASKRHSKVAEEQESSKNNQVRRMGYHKQGLGGLSKERRKKLKKRAPPFDIDGLNQMQLEQKVKSWYEHVKQLESQKYEWEQRLRKQDEEINELTAQLCSIKGHFNAVFAMPILSFTSVSDPPRSSMPPRYVELSTSSIVSTSSVIGQKPILRKVAKPMSTDRLRAMSAAPNFMPKTGHKNPVEMKRKLSDDSNQGVVSYIFHTCMSLNTYRNSNIS